jgi:hypothetical protein
MIFDSKGNIVSNPENQYGSISKQLLEHYEAELLRFTENPAGLGGFFSTRLLDHLGRVLKSPSTGSGSIVFRRRIFRGSE